MENVSKLRSTRKTFFRLQGVAGGSGLGIFLWRKNENFSRLTKHLGDIFDSHVIL